MNRHSDTRDGAPLNNQAQVEGSYMYGSVLASDHASLSHPGTRGAALPSPVGRSVDDSSRNTLGDASQLQRASSGSRIANCVDAVDDGLETALRWVERNCFVLGDVALIVAGTHLLTLHWRDEVSVCFWYPYYNKHPRHGHGETQELIFSEVWRLWALAEVVLKIFITGTRVGRWWLELRREDNGTVAQAFQCGQLILTIVHAYLSFLVVDLLLVLDGDSCDRHMDEPIFQLCMVSLIASAITFSIKLLSGGIGYFDEVPRGHKIVLIAITWIFVFISIWDLRRWLLQRAGVILCLCLVAICLYLSVLLVRRLLRLLQRTRARQHQTDRLPVVTC